MGSRSRRRKETPPIEIIAVGKGIGKRKGSAWDLLTHFAAMTLETNGGVDFYEDMGRNFHATVSALGRTANPGLTRKSRLYPGHTHTTVLAPALNDALLYLYGPHLP